MTLPFDESRAYASRAASNASRTLSRSPSSSINLRRYWLSAADPTALRARVAFVLFAIGYYLSKFRLARALLSLYPEAGRLPVDRSRERIVHVVHVDELEPRALVLGDLEDLALVAVGHDDALDPGPQGGQRLLLQAAHGQ